LGFPISRRGLAKDEILEKLVENLKKIKKSLIICLDEVDNIIPGNQDMLYYLLRINQYVENSVGIIFISNNPFVFAEVDPRIKSSLNVEEIEFRAYSLQEMKDILEERVKNAFYSTAVESGITMLIANYASKKNDVRAGLETLLRAGRMAEKESSKKVKVEYVKKVLQEKEFGKVDETEKNILEVLGKEKLSISKLYNKYCEISGVLSKRKFREHIENLIKANLLKIKKFGRENFLEKI